MLTEVEVGQFVAFGYVVLRNCLSPDKVRTLQEAFDRVSESSASLDLFGTVGSTRLMPFVEADDSFGALVEHPEIMEAMRDIDGTEFLYSGGSDLTANLDDVFWHCDGTHGRQPRTAKTAIYLDDLRNGDGALNVIPGSHHPEFSAALFRSYGPLGEQYRRRKHDRSTRDNIPGAVPIYTKPGDVVLWDNRLWHSAWTRRDGRPRRNMFISYMRDPQDDPIGVRELREFLASHLTEQGSVIYSKEMMRKGVTAREKMATRLEELGVDNVRE